VTYKIRIVCETETGNGKGWHYHRGEQEELDENIPCSEHPEATTRDFVIEETVTS
jgi:hypothetical protein